MSVTMVISIFLLGVALGLLVGFVINLHLSK